MTTHHNIVRRTAATASVLLAVGALSTFPAAAKGGGGGIQHRGSCSHSSEWKLSAKGDDGRIEVEGEVDSNVSGQTWTWRILHNGSTSAHGTATTGGQSGSFTVRRLLVNTAGVDSIGWRARNAASGETCVGGLRF